MKRIKYYIFALIIVVSSLIVLATTTTQDTVNPSTWSSGAITVTAAYNFTSSIGTVQGKLTGVVIEPTGTDTSYKVYVKDEHSIVVFSKTDCNSVDGSYRYAITAANTAGTHFLGVPVSGDITVQVADAAGLTGIVVTVYFEKTPAYGL